MYRTISSLILCTFITNLVLGRNPVLEAIEALKALSARDGDPSSEDKESVWSAPSRYAAASSAALAPK